MIEPCPLCNSVAVKEYLNSASFQLLQCASCGLVRTNQFDKASVNYDSDEYFVDKNHYVENWGSLCLVFDALLDKISRYKNGGVLLDVGCGIGCLVSRSRERGFLSQGVEVSGWASGYARQERELSVFTGTLAEAAFQHGFFDVVVINHVLEHVPDPGSLLREAGRILKGNGLLVVGVPNIGSIMARLTGDDWASLRPQEHRWHFTQETLKAFVSKEGFRILSFEAKDNHPAVGWNFKKIIRRLINIYASFTNRGEAMLVFAVKNDGV